MTLLAKTAMLVGLLAIASLPAPARAQALPPALFLPEVVLPRDKITPADATSALRSGAPKAPLSDFRYTHEGVTKSLADYQSQAKVRALLVLKDGRIVHEYNRFPYGKTSLHQSWSIAKQMLSALVGIAIGEGAIRSVNDRMDAYEPALAVNGFAGVTFKQALQMSSGVTYDEEPDRFQLFMDVITHRYSFGASGQSLRDKTLDAALTRAYPPGSRYQYASINSQAIQMALEKAVGMPYQRYLALKLWQPMGIPDEAKVLVDRPGQAFTFCCAYATSRSYALFGLMYAQGGRLNGRQIVPADWVSRSTTFAGDPSNWHAVPVNGNKLGLYGFGYHWWPLEGERGDFTALGVFGQAIHVLPRQNTVIVRLSGDFDTPGAHIEENVVMGRALADYLD